MNFSAMDAINIDDFFSGGGEGESLFDMEDLNRDFGGDEGNNKFDLEMKWDDPALASITPIEGDIAGANADAAFADAAPNPPAPLDPTQELPTKKKEKKKKKKDRHKLEKKQNELDLSVRDFFDEIPANDTLQHLPGDNQLSKANKTGKSSKKKKAKKLRGLIPVADSPIAQPEEQQIPARDFKKKHQYPPQAKPLPSSLFSTPGVNNDSSPIPNGSSHSQQKGSRTKKKKKERQSSTTSVQSNTSLTDIFAPQQVSTDNKRGSKRKKKVKSSDPFAYNPMQMNMQMSPATTSQGQMHHLQTQTKPNQQFDRGNIRPTLHQKNSNMDPSLYSSLSSLSNNARQISSDNDSQSPFPPLQGIDMSIDYSSVLGHSKRNKNENFHDKQNNEEEKKNSLYQLYVDGYQGNVANTPNPSDKKIGSSRNYVAEKNVSLLSKPKKNTKGKNKANVASKIQPDSIATIEQQAKNNILNNALINKGIERKKKLKFTGFKDDDSHTYNSSKGSRPEGSGKLFGVGSKLYTTPTVLIMNVKVRVEGKVRDANNGMKNLVAHISVPYDPTKDSITSQSAMQSVNTQEPGVGSLRSTSKNQPKLSSTSSNKDQDTSSVKSKKRKSTSSSSKSTVKPKVDLTPNEPTSSNLIPYLLNSSNNFTPSQRRDKLFSFLSTQLDSYKSDDISPEKYRKSSPSKKKEKSDEFGEPNGVGSSMWEITEKRNYFAEVKDEDMMRNLMDAWQPERIEEGPAYWGEMPPVSLVKKKPNDEKSKNTDLFDRLQSLLIVEDDDNSDNEVEKEEVRNLILDSSDTSTSSAVRPNEKLSAMNRSDEIDISRLSLDQRTFIHLRSLHMIDRPYLPHMQPVAIEDDSDNEEEPYSSDDNDSLDISTAHSNDPIFSRIHSLRKKLSDVNHVNNIYTANLQATLKQHMSKEARQKKLEEETILAKYLQKKVKS